MKRMWTEIKPAYWTLAILGGFFFGIHAVNWVFGVDVPPNAILSIACVYLLYKVVKLSNKMKEVENDAGWSFERSLLEQYEWDCADLPMRGSKNPTWQEWFYQRFQLDEDNKDYRPRITRWGYDDERAKAFKKRLDRKVEENCIWNKEYRAQHEADEAEWKAKEAKWKAEAATAKKEGR